MLAEKETASVVAQETVSVVAVENAAIHNTAAANEPVAQSIHGTNPALSERASKTPIHTTPEREHTLPETEAMLMMMLLARS